MLHTIARVKSYTHADEESRESDSLTNLIATRWNVQRNSWTFPHSIPVYLMIRFRNSWILNSTTFIIFYLFLSYICTFIRYFFLSFLAKTKQPHHVNDHRVAPGNNLGKHKHANRRSETFDAWYMRARGQLYVSMRCPEGPKGLNRGLLASTLPRVPTSLPLDLTYTFSTPLPPSSFYPVARYTWGNMAACLLTWAKQWRIHAGPQPVVCPLVFRWSRGPTT